MSVTDKQFAAYVDRVIECREAEDRAKEDTKALYSEISDAGEDKAAIGVLVRELRMTAKDRTKANFKAAAAEDASVRYQRGKASHVRVREASIPEHDADGVIIESTAARKDVPVGRLNGAAVEIEPNAPPAGTQAPPVDTNNEPDATMRPQTVGHETAVANSGALGLTSSDPQRSVAATRKDAGAGAPGPNDQSKPNPWCLDPEECGLSSWEHFCGRCQRVKAERQSVSAVQ